MNEKTMKMNKIFPATPVIPVVLRSLALASVLPLAVLANPPHPSVSPSSGTGQEGIPGLGPEYAAISEAAEAQVQIDRILADSRRVLDLVTMLGQVAAALKALQPYREPILALLDGERPVDERWRNALYLVPSSEESGGSAGASAAVAANPELEAEVARLRQEIDALRAEMPVLGFAPELPVPESIQSPDPAAEREWVFDRGSIRYVQLADAGSDTIAAVWLASPSGIIPVALGETVHLEDRQIRLAELRPEPGGRVQLLFAVDGNPTPITW